MKYELFSEQKDRYDTALLIKENSMKNSLLLQYYIRPLSSEISQDNIIAIGLPYNDKEKAPVKFIKEQLSEILPKLDSVGVRHLLVADAAYFKVLTGISKVEANIGSYFPCVIKDWEHFTVAPSVNYNSIMYNPDNQNKIDNSLKAFISAYLGQSTDIGGQVLKDVTYIKRDEPNYYSTVRDALEELKKSPKLAVDIEAFSLNFYEAGIATISFSPSKEKAVCIQVDWENCNHPGEPMLNGCYSRNDPIRQLLHTFFITYSWIGTTIWHNANYDLKVLVYTLFMKEDHFAYSQLLDGIEVMTRNFEDTKLITYLARNSCADISLKLKDNIIEFAGNYAQDSDDIKDIRRIPLSNLMPYNAIDTCGTFYLYEKYWDKMVADQQLDVYQNIFKPSVAVILQMELTGMPINMDKVLEVEKILEGKKAEYTEAVMNHPMIHELWLHLRQKESDAAHAKWKKKEAPIEAFDYVKVNPNSGDQLQVLLYELMGLPVIEKTKSGAPSTKKKVLQNLKNHTNDSEHLSLLDGLIGLSEVVILLTTFINAFKHKSILKSDGWYYLHGSFNLGGTVSGRLSSSGPNLQNIPSSGNPHSKLIKSCVQAPPGWVWVGADFASLEDRISALTTKDKNKLKVYTDGYDGHMLRAYTYVGEYMPDINIIPDNEKGYRVEQEDGKVIYLKSDTMVVCPDNQLRTIKDYYDSVRTT